MKSILVVCLAGVLLSFANCERDIIQARMDTGAVSTQCGKLELGFSQEAHLSSSGKTPQGSYYSLLISAVGDLPANCTYRKLCVDVTRSRMDFCYAKVHISGKHFEREDITAEMGCGKKIPEDWCTSAEYLEVTVLEKSNYAETDGYAFNITVSSKCSKSDGDEQEINDDYVPIDLEEAIHQARIIGVIVAVCLACMFLIMLLLTYLWYKNKKDTGNFRQES